MLLLTKKIDDLRQRTESGNFATIARKLEVHMSRNRNKGFLCPSFLFSSMNIALFVFCIVKIFFSKI
jgi:hypothetical protein